MQQAAVVPILAAVVAIVLLILLLRANARAAGLQRAVEAARSAEHAAALREAELSASASAGQARLTELSGERDELMDALHQLREVKAALERDLTELLDRLNRAGPGSLVVPSEYLEVVASRR